MVYKTRLRLGWIGNLPYICGGEREAKMFEWVKYPASFFVLKLYKVQLQRQSSAINYVAAHDFIRS
jgi:hypothetical protein